MKVESLGAPARMQFRLLSLGVAITPPVDISMQGYWLAPEGHEAKAMMRPDLVAQA